MTKPFLQAPNPVPHITDNLITAIEADGGLVDYNLFRNEYLAQHHLVKKGASLLVAGGAYKAGTVYGFNPQSAALIPFAFTRAGTVGTYVDKTGLLVSAAANVPRMDYDPVTGKFKGLLMERASTNLFLNSEDVNAGYTLKTAITVTSNAAIAPDGNTTADFVKEDTSNGNHIIASPSITKTASGVYSYSFFVKPGGRDFVRIQIGNAASTEYSFVHYQFSTNTFSSATNSAGFSAPTYSAIVMQNGWVRLLLTATTDTTTTALGTLLLGSAGGYTGDGVSGVYVWGTQFEAGQPTSYIPTAGTTATRAAETCSAAVGAWFNATEGAIYANAIRNTGNNNNSSFIDLYTDNNNKMTLRPAGWTGYVSNVVQWGISQGVPFNALTKLAGAYKLNDCNEAVAGALGTTDTSATIPTVATMYLGVTDSNLIYLDGYIRSVAYFPVRLQNLDLLAITL